MAAAVTGPGRVARSCSTASPRRSAGTSLLSPMTHLPLATRHIPVESRTALQRSLIRSHAAGAGPAVEAEVVRALMLLRLRTLASGYTGVRPGTAQALAALLNADITPVVHEYGSLGC